jgi:hypothetical protein
MVPPLTSIYATLSRRWLRISYAYILYIGARIVKDEIPIFGVCKRRIYSYFKYRLPHIRAMYVKA